MAAITRLAPGQGLQAPVHLGVDPADEERGDAGHPRELRRPPGRHQRLQAADVRLNHLVVAVEPEDQGDVDAPSLAQQGVDGRHALLGRRHLDQQIRLRDPGVQHAGVAHRALGVVRQRGGHLQGDVAVLTVALLVDGPQELEPVQDVGDGQLPVGALHRVVGDELLELGVVRVLPADGVGEDGGVGGDPPHARSTPARPAGRRRASRGGGCPTRGSGRRCRRDPADGSCRRLLACVVQKCLCPFGHMVNREPRIAPWPLRPGADAPKRSSPTEASA